MINDNHNDAGSMPAPLVVSGFAEGEGYVAVFDHVLDLSPHCGLQLVVFLCRGRDGIVMAGGFGEGDLLVTENKMRK